MARGESCPKGPELLAQAQAQALDPEKLLEICERALVSAPEDLWTLFQIGSLARDAGLSGVAERIFRHIVERDPDAGYAAYHFAWLCKSRGDDGDALRVLQTSRAQSVYDSYINTLSAELLARRGEVFEARRCADRVSDPALKNEAAAYAEFAEFFAEYPLDVAVGLAEQVENGPDYLPPPAVAEQIQCALQSGAGFSLVRMGDGEGAFLRFSAEEETRFQHLYARNRTNRAQVWFDDELDIVASGFAQEMSRIARVMEHATIVGLPYPNWLRHEFEIHSPTGYSSLVNVLRWYTDRPAGARACSQLINVDLYKQGHLDRILGQVPELGLISCHPSLPERLKGRFGLKSVEFHKVPGEKAMRRIIGDAAAAGVHYPDAFRKVMSALDRPLAGKLFLVAAGILGKFYCDRIRASGGVALDIGSIADGWAGTQTRPTVDDTMAL